MRANSIKLFSAAIGQLSEAVHGGVFNLEEPIAFITEEPAYWISV